MNTDLEVLKTSIRSCNKCHLRKLTKVPCWDDKGNTESSLMIVAEAEGKNEAEQGIPFVGRAGEYLNRLLIGIGLSREKVFISNTVMCRPTETGVKDRAPTDEEISICSPYLHRQIELIKPKIIVSLGRVSMSTLVNNKNLSIKTHKATVLDYCLDSSIKIFPLWHPSFIVSYAGDSEIKENWNDWLKLKAVLNEYNV